MCERGLEFTKFVIGFCYGVAGVRPHRRSTVPRFAMARFAHSVHLLTAGFEKCNQVLQLGCMVIHFLCRGRQFFARTGVLLPRRSAHQPALPRRRDAAAAHGRTRRVARGAVSRRVGFDDGLRRASVGGLSRRAALGRLSQPQLPGPGRECVARHVCDGARFPGRSGALGSTPRWATTRVFRARGPPSRCPRAWLHGSP